MVIGYASPQVLYAIAAIFRVFEFIPHPGSQDVHVFYGLPVIAGAKRAPRPHMANAVVNRQELMSVVIAFPGHLSEDVLGCFDA